MRLTEKLVREALQQATPGPYRQGRGYGAVVSDSPEGIRVMGAEDREAYGGYLIAESISETNQPLVRLSWETARALLHEHETLAVIEELLAQAPPEADSEAKVQALSAIREWVRQRGRAIEG